MSEPIWHAGFCGRVAEKWTRDCNGLSRSRNRKGSTNVEIENCNCLDASRRSRRDLPRCIRKRWTCASNSNRSGHRCHRLRRHSCRAYDPWPPELIGKMKRGEVSFGSGSLSAFRQRVPGGLSCGRSLPQELSLSVEVAAIGNLQRRTPADACSHGSSPATISWRRREPLVVISGPSERSSVVPPSEERPRGPRECRDRVGSHRSAWSR